MIKKIWFGVTALIVTGIAVFGISHKSTYTDITSEKDYMDRLQVAVLNDSSVDELIREMKTQLPESSMVFRVTALEGREYEGREGRQLVHVEKVYQGEKSYEKQEVYLTSDTWGIGQEYARMGFVNTMNPEEEYLIFLEEKVETAENRINKPMFRVAGYAITPIFSYTEHNNVIVSVDTEDVYTDYKSVSQNEFFVGSESILQLVMGLKQEVLSLYPK